MVQITPAPRGGFLQHWEGTDGRALRDRQVLEGVPGVEAVLVLGCKCRSGRERAVNGTLSTSAQLLKSGVAAGFHSGKSAVM